LKGNKVKKTTNKLSQRQLQAALKQNEVELRCRTAEAHELRAEREKVYRDCADRVNGAALQIEAAADHMRRLNDQIYQLKRRNERLKCYVDVLLTSLATAQNTSENPFPELA
jgi:putative protein kinase ArgK-like GTPase of G3E family